MRNFRYPEGLMRADGSPWDDVKEERGGVAAPPTLIGGVNSQKINLKKLERVLGIDWIQGTIANKYSEKVYDYLSKMCDCEPEIFDHGVLGFQRHAVWHPYGIVMAWDVDLRNKDIHHGKFLLQLGGEACGCFFDESIYQFCWDLCTKFAFKCSRVDLCFDDFERIKSPNEVYQECCAGEEKNYSGYRKHRFIDEERSTGEKSGETLYFGTRGKNGGGKFLRCYDKELESDGEINSVRWEVEFSKERANAVFFKIALSMTIEEFATNIAMLIGGSIDFIERKGKNLDRAERLPFWEKIVSILGEACIRNPRPIKTVEKCKAWMERCVFPSQSMMQEAFGDKKYYEWAEEQIEEATLSKLQRRVVSEYWGRNGKPKDHQVVPF